VFWHWICVAFLIDSPKCEEVIGPPPCKGRVEQCQQDIRPNAPPPSYERTHSRRQYDHRRQHSSR